MSHPVPAVRHAGSPASRSSVLDRMTSLGCDSRLTDVLRALPSGTPMTVNDGVGHFLPIAGGTDCVAALYMDRRHLHQALTPDQAERLHRRTGLRKVTPNQTTVRVRVTAGDLVDDGVRDLVTEAVEQALLRAARRAGRVTALEAAAAAQQRSRRLCTVSRELVPASGLCDDHGASGS